MKHEILEHLKEHKNNYVSGEQLSRLFNVSRMAINKAVKSFIKQGYIIDCKQNAGYKLVSSDNVLTAYEIAPFLQNNIIGKNIEKFDQIDSTNTYAKRLLNKKTLDAQPSTHELSGTVIIAESQTGGRGRHGKAWTTPTGKGLYFSIILTPENMELLNASKITVLIATAVHQALREETQLSLSIKWPNDIFLGNKKICGILTEIGGEAPYVNHIVIGIGINVNTDLADMPTDLHNIATSFKIETNRIFDRKMMLVKILNTIDYFYRSFIETPDFYADILTLYKSASIVLGREFSLVTPDGTTVATALDISNDGFLIARLQSGEIKHFSYGEISVKL